MSEKTTVNAGFSKVIPGARGAGRHAWKNVKGIVIDMPASLGMTREFRAQVEKAKPDGGGWVLQGYAILEPKETTK